MGMRWGRLPQCPLEVTLLEPSKLDQERGARETWGCWGTWRLCRPHYRPETHQDMVLSIPDQWLITTVQGTPACVKQVTSSWGKCICLLYFICRQEQCIISKKTASLSAHPKCILLKIFVWGVISVSDSCYIKRALVYSLQSQNSTH